MAGNLHNWHPADVLHFPFRSRDQWENKGVRRARRRQPRPVRHRALASRGGRSAERYSGLVVEDAALERGRSERMLVCDIRLRDSLRTRVGAVGTDGPVADESFIADSIGAREADIVRLTRFVDGLCARVAKLESRGRGCSAAVSDRLDYRGLRRLVTLDAHIAFHPGRASTSLSRTRRSQMMALPRFSSGTSAVAMSIATFGLADRAESARGRRVPRRVGSPTAP